MPHFCKCGSDEYVCQSCGKAFCSREQPSVWMNPVPGKLHEGNVCPGCRQMAEIIDTAAKDTFKMSRSEAVSKRLCIRCGSKAGLFRDRKSVKEYQQSGFCQKCQDLIFVEL
jgi:Zn ribbon nucleic-acid-binding protein